MSRAAMLDAYLAEVQARPFDWAAWNCCTFAAEWVRRASGLQPMAGLPATGSAAAALRLHSRMGASLADAVTLQLGLAPFAAELAQVGDVVAVREGSAQAVGICTGRLAAVLRLDGLAHVPMGEASLAWRVGRC
jgi:hypothetical protein